MSQFSSTRARPDIGDIFHRAVMSPTFRSASSSPALSNVPATRCLLKEMKASNVHAEGVLFVFLCLKQKHPPKEPPLTTPSLPVKVCAWLILVGGLKEQIFLTTFQIIHQKSEGRLSCPLRYPGFNCEAWMCVQSVSERNWMRVTACPEIYGHTNQRIISTQVEVASKSCKS